MYAWKLLRQVYAKNKERRKCSKGESWKTKKFYKITMCAEQQFRFFSFYTVHIASV